jgi:RNA-directed DNA polymerase
VKSWRNLFPRITSFRNLYLAFRSARCGKPLTAERAAFEVDLEENLFRLQNELVTGTYLPDPYRTFYVTEGVRRKISAARFRDRVVHHALHRVIEPLFEREFIFDSYACRAGKGTHRAADRCRHFLRRYPYVLQADIARFFPSVDHAILEALLGRRIHDERTMDLVRRIIESGVGILDSEYYYSELFDRQTQWPPVL